MSLATYADLQAAVASWLNRTDLTTQIPDFIALGEARIRRNQEWFTQVYSLKNGASLTVTTNPVSLPANVKEILALWADTATFHHTIDVVPASEWRDLANSNANAAGTPVKACFFPEMDGFPGTAGPQLYLWPPASVAGDGNSFVIDFQYVEDVPALASSVSGLFTRHPDLYLYAALAESAPFLVHDERLPVWEARYQQVVKEVNIERERAQFSASAKVPRLPRVF